MAVQSMSMLVRRQPSLTEIAMEHHFDSIHKWSSRASPKRAYDIDEILEPLNDSSPDYCQIYRTLVDAIKKNHWFDYLPCERLVAMFDALGFNLYRMRPNILGAVVDGIRTVGIESLFPYADAAEKWWIEHYDWPNELPNPDDANDVEALFVRDCYQEPLVRYADTLREEFRVRKTDNVEPLKDPIRLEQLPASDLLPGGLESFVCQILRVKRKATLPVLSEKLNRFLDGLPKEVRMFHEIGYRIPHLDLFDDEYVRLCTTEDESPGKLKRIYYEDYDDGYIGLRLKPDENVEILLSGGLSPPIKLNMSLSHFFVDRILDQLPMSHCGWYADGIGENDNESTRIWKGFDINRKMVETFCTPDRTLIRRIVN